MLWNRKKPLNQPPSYGRIGVLPEKTSGFPTKAIDNALTAARIERREAAQRHGISRAVVKG